MIHTYTHIEQARRNGQDRLLISQSKDITMAFLADGAGGSAGGTLAAEITLRMAQDELSRLHNPGDILALERTLRAIDRALAASHDTGETTAIIVVITPTEVTGVSVGDSQCWGFDQELQFGFEWTAQQYKKPFIGTGKATPVAFGPFAPQGTILLGSDGLFDYSSHQDQLACLQQTPIQQAPPQLAELVRLPNRQLRDDLALAIIQFD